MMTDHAQDSKAVSVISAKIAMVLDVKKFLSLETA
jgi:hypothetical protein